MGELDFTGKTVLVVGGSSGIGNGIAHAFRERGAQVHVWGTRADAAAYAGVEGSDLRGLTYAKVDVGERADRAGAALFLASPLASYVVGQTLIVDGGLSL